LGAEILTNVGYNVCDNDSADVAMHAASQEDATIMTAERRCSCSNQVSSIGDGMSQ